MGQGGATGASQQGRARGGRRGGRGGSPPHATRPREIAPGYETGEGPTFSTPTPRPTSLINQMRYITGGPVLDYSPHMVGGGPIPGADHPTLGSQVQAWEYPGRRRGGRRGGGRWRAEHDAIRERLGVGPSFPNPPGGPPPPTPPYQVGRAYTLGSGGSRNNWANRNRDRIAAGETGMRRVDDWVPPRGMMPPGMSPMTPPPSPTGMGLGSPEMSLGFPDPTGTFGEVQQWANEVARLNPEVAGLGPQELLDWANDPAVGAPGQGDFGDLISRAEQGFQQALAQVRHLNPELAGLGDQEVLAWARANATPGLLGGGNPLPGTTPIIGPQGLVQNGPIYGDRTINPANLPPTDLWGEVASRNSRLAGNPGGPLAMRQRNIDNWTSPATGPFPLTTPSFGDVDLGFGNITPPYPPGTGFGGGGYEVPPDFNVPSYNPTPTPSYGDQGLQAYGGRTLQDWLPAPANLSDRNTLSYTDGAGLRDHFGFSESQAPGRYVPAGLFADWLGRDPRRQANIDNWSVPNYVQEGFNPFAGGGYGQGTGPPIFNPNLGVGGV